MKFSSLAIIASSGLILAGCSLLPQAAAPSPQPTVETSMEASPTTETTMELSYTLADIAKHTTPEDCWMAIEGKVYDVSNFGDTHPGGDTIYTGCGIDATELFNTRPMGPGTPHSDEARSFLPNFEIGILAQ